MSRGCFIGIDQGSSSTKALVVGTDGQVLFRTRRELSAAFREGLRVEQDPREILQSVRDVLDEALRAAQAAGATALAAGLSCQRSSCLVWDEAGGKPFSPVLSWRDTRGTESLLRLPDRRRQVWETTGLPLTPYYSASKLRWLKENIPQDKLPGAVFGALSSFLVQQLTKSPRASIDHTNAARTQLMGINTLSWDRELLDLFDLAGVRLPEIVPTARDFGTAKTKAGDVPLLACIGDQQAAMAGLGVLEQGEGGVNCGTGGFLMVNTGETLKPAGGLMASIHYSFDDARSYLLEGSVNAAGDALEWLRTRFGLFKDYAELDDLCWKASTDVAAFIGLNGTGAPHWETGVSSLIHGLTAESSSADIVRAVVEGIAFFLADIAAALKDAAVEPRSLTASGGLASLTYLMQALADILGMNLSVSAEQEASAKGAAFLAGMRHGTWSAWDIKSMLSAVETVTARTNPGLRKRYSRWKELHRVTRELDLG